MRNSYTLNNPLPLDDPASRENARERLQMRRDRLETERSEILRELQQDKASDERHDDLTGKLEEIDEAINDIDKQLDESNVSAVDHEQLDWLRDRLIASWRDRSVRGRIVFFHHPPYVTEKTKWFQGQTLAVRHRLRMVLNAVKAEVGDIAQGQPLLSLVLCGHAHCLEYLRTADTGHGDANIPWIVCGGSGYSLRRQRSEGNELTEEIKGEDQVVATSHLFLGRTGKGSSLQRPYSALRVEVREGNPLQLSVVPLISEQRSEGWHGYTHEPIQL